jgi:hypothetical protein
LSKESEKLNVDRYLFGSGYSIGLSLSACNTLSLHWADCADMVALQRKFYDTASKFQFQLLGLRRDMAWIRSKEVFIRSSEESDFIYTMTLMDIFEMLLNQDKSVSVVQFSPDSMVSVNGAGGPYHPFVAHDWFSYHSFQAYVYQRLLIGKLNVRKFRLRTDVDLCCATDTGDKFSIRLKQLSNLGLLLYCRNSDDYYRISLAKKFNFWMNLNHLDKLKECQSIEEIRSYVSSQTEGDLFVTELEAHLVDVDLGAIGFDDRQLASREYLFIPYCALKVKGKGESTLSNMINQLLQNLESVVKLMVDQYYIEHGIDGDE